MRTYQEEHCTPTKTHTHSKSEPVLIVETMMNFLDLSAASEEERQIIREILADTSVVNIAEHLCQSVSNLNNKQTTPDKQQQPNNINTIKSQVALVSEVGVEVKTQTSHGASSRSKDTRLKAGEQLKRVRSNQISHEPTTTSTAGPSLKPKRHNPQVPQQQPTSITASVAAPEPKTPAFPAKQEPQPNDNNTSLTSGSARSGSSPNSSNPHKSNEPSPYPQNQPPPPQHANSEAAGGTPQNQTNSRLSPPDEATHVLHPQAAPTPPAVAQPTMAHPKTSDINTVIGLDMSSAAAAAAAAVSTQPPGYAISPHVTAYGPPPPHHHHVYGGPPILQPYHYFIHPYNMPPTAYMPYVIAPNSVVPPATNTTTRQQVPPQSNQQSHQQPNLSASSQQLVGSQSNQSFHHMSIQQNHQYNGTNGPHGAALNDNHHHHHNHNHIHHNSGSGHHHHQHHQHHHHQTHVENRRKNQTNHESTPTIVPQIIEKLPSNNHLDPRKDYFDSSTKSTVNGIIIHEAAPVPATPSSASKLSNNDNMVTKLTHLMTNNSTQKSANELDANHKMPNNDSSIETVPISQEQNPVVVGSSNSASKKFSPDSSPSSTNNKTSNSLLKNGHSATTRSKNFFPNNARNGEKAQNHTPKPDIDSTVDNVSRTQSNNNRNTRSKVRDGNAQLPRSAFLGPKINGDELVKHSSDKSSDTQQSLDVSKQHSNQPSTMLPIELAIPAPLHEEKSKTSSVKLAREKDELSDAKSSRSSSDIQNGQASLGSASSKSWASLFKSQQEDASKAVHRVLAKE